MSRCRNQCTLIIALSLTSLFLLFGCGIPRYFNLDNEAHIKTTKNSEESLEVTISFDEGTALQKSEFNLKDNSVGWKFFYVLSTNSSPTAPISSGFTFNDSYTPNSIRSAFNTNIRTTGGNGRQWGAERGGGSNPSAVGFYLYTNVDKKALTFAPNTSEISSDQYFDDGGILVGTFAMSENLNNTPYYGAHPFMDYKIGLNKETKLTITKEELNGDPRVLILNDGVKDYYLFNFKKRPFEIGKLSEESPQFYTELAQDALTSGLYLHLYGALYAKEGLFTNIYWSKLEYIGVIKLFE